MTEFACQVLSQIESSLNLNSIQVLVHLSGFEVKSGKCSKPMVWMGVMWTSMIAVRGIEREFRGNQPFEDFCTASNFIPQMIELGMTK